MRFGVLGPLAVWASDGTAVRVPERKVRALLADLLVNAGRPVSSERLIDDIWGEVLPENPTNTLQIRVSQLRRVLDGAEPGGRELVQSQPPGYVLKVAADAIDVGQFRTMTAEARATQEPQARATLLSDALALWRGPAFADFRDEPFALALIARLDEERLVAIEEHSEARLALGEHYLLVGELGDLVAKHPLRQRLRAAHMLALYRAGRHSEALDSYQALRTHLGEELGLDPSADLTALQQAILRQDPGLGAVPAPANIAIRPRTNLPESSNDLVGRAAAITEVRSLLGTSRVVTLTGPGGVGKTRLAVEVARQLQMSFADGTWIVELAAVEASRDPDVDSLSETVAAVLDVRESGTMGKGPGGWRAGLADRIAGALQARELLLIVDSCEHVIEPTAKLVDLLLRSAPRLRVLATSREPLGIGGERLWPVPPLELPKSADVQVAAMRRASAVELFVARATAAAPGFVLDMNNASAAWDICRQLDGLPLALELAAARVRVLGVHELATRLIDRFHILTAGYRDAPTRQQTLRAVIDWSWGLLSERERTVLRRLAVHADGCTLAAAEAVCAGGSVESADIVDLLSRLVDRSLVGVAGGVETRYRLLETVAAYCQERLHEAGEADATRQRHAGYYVELAERAASMLRGHDQRRWLDRLDADSANLRAALDWAVQTADVELALRQVDALAWYWILRGRHSESRRSLTAALSVDTAPSELQARAATWLSVIELLESTDADPARISRDTLARYDGINQPAARAHAQWLLGFAMRGSARLAIIDRLLDEALETFRQLGDRWGQAAALSARSWQAHRRGDIDAARRDGEESDALFRDLGDGWGQAQVAELFGVLAEGTGDLAGATRVLRHGLRMAEDLGLWPDAAKLLGRLGRIAMMTDDYPAALELHERAAKLSREQSYQAGIAFAEIGLGLIARRQGRLGDAEKHLRSVLDQYRSTNFEPGLALVLAELGFIAEMCGDADGAQILHVDGLAAARATRDPRAVALGLEGLAGVQALTGDHAQAARLLGAAAAARELVGPSTPRDERDDVHRITSAVRNALGPAFDDELRRGRQLSVDELADIRPLA